MSNLKRTKEIWRSMWKRCGGINGKNKGSPLYMLKSISVCSEWLNFNTFLSDMGLAPDNMSLDRIENDLGYFKNNCRWATHKTQTRNRTNTLTVYYQGETWFLKDLSDHLGIRYDTLHYRIKNGWVDSELARPISKANCSYKLKENGSKKISFKGNNYSLKDFASLCGVSTTTLRNLLHEGFTELECYEKSKIILERKNRSQVVYKGQSSSIHELATLFKIPYKLLRRRILELNWDESRWSEPVKNKKPLKQ